MESRPVFFQPALSSTSDHPSGFFNDRLGEIVTGADDVGQCIYIILTTPLGADPHRPTFGSQIYRYIDSPIDSARPYIVREAIDALRVWEPRINVLRVIVGLSDIAALTCEIEWIFAEGIDTEVFRTGAFALVGNRG
jgi:phage baseplate assembly protein W